MYTLPTNIRIRIRKIEKPLRELVHACVKSWEGDTVFIIISDRANKRSVDEEPVFTRFDLVTGAREVLPRFHSRRYYVAIAEGEAIVKAEYYAEPWRCEIIIFVRSFSALCNELDELDVARDAFLDGDPQAAHRIAKATLPYGHGLFEALIAHEHKLLHANADATRRAESTT